MTHDEVIAKVKKLRALATSDNVHEAAAAAAAAERLLQQYRLSEAELEAEDDAPHETAALDAEPVDVFGRNLQHWRAALLTGMCKLHGCRNWSEYAGNGKRVFRIVGRPSDVATVRYLYAWLVSEIERLAQRHGKGQGRTWFNSYRRGAVNGVLAAMREANQEARAAVSSVALVKIDARKVEADQIVDALGMNRKKIGGRVRLDRDAYGRGERDGRAIHQGKSLPNGAGPRLLGVGT
jgi:hypothetical protein